jgi:hypothetical protein
MKAAYPVAILSDLLRMPIQAIVPPIQGPLHVVVPFAQACDQRLVVSHHSLQRLICLLLELGHGLLHQKTFRGQTKDICLRLLYLPLQMFNLGSLVKRESYSNIQTENLLGFPLLERATITTWWRR